jgi:hypothetical protein
MLRRDEAGLGGSGRLEPGDPPLETVKPPLECVDPEIVAVHRLPPETP